MARKKRVQLADPHAAGTADDEMSEGEYEISEEEYEAIVQAGEEIKRERIAAFQQLLRDRKIIWSDEEAWKFLQPLRKLIVRAAFRNAPLDGSKPTPADAEATVLDVAAALARHAQRMATRRETATQDHADIRTALEAEVEKRKGKLGRGAMKQVFIDAERTVAKARKKERRNGPSERTIKRVWREMKLKGN